MIGDDRNRSSELTNFGNMLFSHESQQLVLVRNLEELYRKKIRSSFDVTFNKTCLNENLLPKYTEVYIYIYIYIYCFIPERMQQHNYRRYPIISGGVTVVGNDCVIMLIQK